MKTHILVCISMLVFCFSGVAYAADQTQQRTIAIAGAYNAAVTYSGVHKPDALLFKNSAKATDWFTNPKLARLQKVTCPDALKALQREGVWKGHLKPNGSCGSLIEPAYWTTGNKLNYDATLEQAAR